MTKIIFTALIMSLTPVIGVAQTNLKKQERIQKRFIHPKSKYLTFSAGWGFTTIVTKDPNNFLRQGLLHRNNVFIPEIRYEHGIKNNLFVETGISQIGQGIFLKALFDDTEIAVYRGLYKSYYIDLGAGYRIMNANNFHFANIHAGLFAGIANTNKSNIPSQYGYLITDNTNNKTQATINVSHFNPIAFGSYIGISKEIRLSKDVRFFVKYVQRFGLVNTLSGSIDLSSQTIDYNAGLASFKVRGGGAFITGGLKILLFQKNLKNE